MNKIIPLPKITRMNLIKAFLYYKRIIRLQLVAQSRYTSAIEHLGRVTRLLKAKGNAFDSYRIARLEAKATSLWEERKQAREALTASGQLLINLMPHADKVLSFHDKCQLLNINHTAALKALDNDDTVSFEKMIFVHSLEYRGSEDTLPIDDISTPYWCAMHQRFIEEMKINSKLRAAASTILDEMLSGVRRFQLHIMPDGAEVLKQLPPTLTVVK